MTDVLLVCMPFGPVFAPSIGLSLLKAQLTRHGTPSRVRYFSIDFAERVGQDFYCGIASEGRPSTRELAGEWIFSRALFESALDDPEAYVQEVLLKPGMPCSDSRITPALVRRVLRARDVASGFVDWCLEEIRREQPRVVGFTSVFQQHVASLALAQRLKRAMPATFVVMGGANCEGVMGAETVRQFSFVDAVVSGEGENVFPQLVRRVLDGQAVEGLPGIRTPANVGAEFASGRFPNAPSVMNLDELPYPDYGDYFEQFEASRYAGEWQPEIFYETSRGCWWGERMHCTFCGLNGSTMAFRSKSARRALDELAHLTEHHPGCDVRVTDNILDMGYFKDFLPEMAARRLAVDLFFETKSNLKKDHLRTLRAAGVSRIQPGIESLSDDVLKRMRKGVSAMQNVQLLKWCHELGVVPFWNILWGFAGEAPAEYDRMARLVPLLTHLQPPVGFGTLRLDRFSPNFFDAERLGFTDVRPLPPYRHVYPLAQDAVANLAYYFSFRHRVWQDVESYVAPLAKALRAWQRAHGRSALFSVDTGDTLLLWDLRPSGREPLTVLRGVERTLYRTCDAASDVRQLASAASNGSELPPDEIDRRLEPLMAQGLLIKDGPRYLALAVPVGDYSPPAWAAERMYEIARHVGRRDADSLVVPLGVGAAGPAARAAARALERAESKLTAVVAPAHPREVLSQRPGRLGHPAVGPLTA
ncbi:MAG: RiPP maturation radical SAM protein 1 [Acidobacteria bacterium]|nr:RiPP maturation radical SAM protein 1 [Acidobacteriota bacterium]